jgi:hypothetical protein
MPSQRQSISVTDIGIAMTVTIRIWSRLAMGHLLLASQLLLGAAIEFAMDQGVDAKDMINRICAIEADRMNRSLNGNGRSQE